LSVFVTGTARGEGGDTALPGLRLDPEGDDPHIRGQVFRPPTSLPVLFGPPAG
jgi:hypothetical protein